MNRFFASAAVALLAGMVAHNAGIPVWRDWEPGDVADIALTTFYATFFLIGALRVKVEINNNFKEPTELTPISNRCSAE